MNVLSINYSVTSRLRLPISYNTVAKTGKYRVVLSLATEVAK